MFTDSSLNPLLSPNPVQRYEKLLDAACQRDEEYKPTEDPRRLRPGEIDPNPESKPARPDPVDMDDEEKEMLSEARARLANTKGKKAKRKAREKQLEEARRLASLQKHRELKAAGIETLKRSKRVRGIDYNAEIPFERKPAPGYFGTVAEVQAQAIQFQEDNFKPMTMAELEGISKRHLEEQLQKQDTKRQRIFERRSAPSDIREVEPLNAPGSTDDHRAPLVLPQPQVSDVDVIGRLALTRATGATVDQSSRNTARSDRDHYMRGLTQASVDTISNPNNSEAILQEAKSLRELQEGQTPLLGKHNCLSHDYQRIESPSEHDMIVLRELDNKDLRGEPMLEATGTMQLSDDHSLPSAEVRRPELCHGTPRQDFHMHGRLNHLSHISADHDNTATYHIKSDLASLPAANNEYRVAVPAVHISALSQPPAEIKGHGIRHAKDASEFGPESITLNVIKSRQRNLPRIMSACPCSEQLIHRKDSGKMILSELVDVLENDLLIGNAYERDHFVTRNCAGNIARSAAILAKEIRAMDVMDLGNTSFDEYAHVNSMLRKKWVVDDLTLKARPLISQMDQPSTLEGASSLHKHLKQLMDCDARKAGKFDGKVQIHIVGFQKRCLERSRTLKACCAALGIADGELDSYGKLWNNEKLSTESRITGIKANISSSAEREITLQCLHSKLDVQLIDLKKASQSCWPKKTA